MPRSRRRHRRTVRALRAAGLPADPRDPAVAPPGQPRRWPRDADDAAVRAGFTKSTRQRINGAERRRPRRRPLRHRRLGRRSSAVRAARPARSARPCDGFATLLEGDRRAARLPVRATRTVFVDWWTAAHAAGLLVYLEARDDDDPGGSLGGLLLYRHGERLSTVHSADRTRGARQRIRASCTCCAGGRSSSRSGRAAPRWTWAGSTSGRTTASRPRATRWPACTSTSARSGPNGSR